MEKLGQDNIYSQFLGQNPIVRTYKGTDLINEYTPLYTPPADWSDIRTDCPENSIALYAGHTPITGGPLPYTKVGNPTITGSTYTSNDNNYLIAKDCPKYCTFVAKITTGADVNSWQYVLSSDKLFDVTVENGYLRCYRFNTAENIQLCAVSANTPYYIKADSYLDSEYNMKQFSVSLDGTDWTYGTANFVDNAPDDVNDVYVGRHLSVDGYYFKGSFDLSATYVKNTNDSYFIAPYVAQTIQYDNLGFTATCVGGYKIYIDGTQYGSTYASDTQCNITWSSLALTTGDDITTPSALKAHKIWIEPATSGNNITAFRCNRVAASGTEQQGVLWGHFNLVNAIRISNCFGTELSTRNTLLRAVTAKNNLITYKVGYTTSQSGIYGSFAYASSLEYLPILKAENQSYASGTYMSFLNVPAKKVVIKNNTGNENFSILCLTNVEEFIIKNGLTLGCNMAQYNSANSPVKLKKFPKINQNKHVTLRINNAPALEPVDIDDRFNDIRTAFHFYGNSTALTKLQSLRISNKAPFNYGTTPQINVNYTSMDSSALRQLFCDLPYNVGYDIIGGVTIDNNDVATGFDCYPNSSAYLRVGPATAPVYGFDSKIKVITGSSIDNDPIIGRGGNNFSTPTISFRSTTRIEVSVRDTDATILYSYAGDLSTPLQLNTTYYAVTTYNGDTWTWKVLDASDNVLWTHTSTSISPLINMRLTLGGWQTDVSYSKFKGSIDLKNSYINIQSTTNKGLVGYEIVGSPTITNGVASGFSVNNYLKSEQHLPAKVKTLEVNVEFTLPATISASTKNTGIVSWAAQHNNDNYLDAYVHINDNNNITAYMFRDVNNNYRAYSIDGYNLATHPNETFITNFKTDLSTVECKLYNKTGTLLAEQTYTNQKLDGSLYWEFYVGVRATLMHAFNGAVNLNNTYLILDGKVWCGQGQELVPWFTRKENMVKKIGCTGCYGNQGKLTIVGSPTINNGVISNYSSSNYVTINNNVVDNSMEFYTKLIKGSSAPSGQANLLLFSGYGFGIYAFANGDIRLQIKDIDGNYRTLGLGTVDDVSYLKFIVEPNKVEAYKSSDGITYTLRGTLDYAITSLLNAILSIGKTDNYTSGSIDLNETYIKVNDELWFGRDQYLLPEDKAIVTNKGWAFN